jgi:hypothetical protein
VSKNVANQFSKEEIANLVLGALAEVRNTTVEQLVGPQGEAREVVCDSKEGEVVVAMLEQRLGRELAGPQDLRPDQLTSVNALASLIQTGLGEG